MARIGRSAITAAVIKHKKKAVKKPNLSAVPENEEIRRNSLLDTNEDKRIKPLSDWREMIYEKFVIQNWFNYLVMLMIIVNCVALALSDPRSDSGKTYQMLTIAEYVFAVFFTIEMIIKMIGLGFFRDGGHMYLGSQYHLPGYFRDNWNVMDFIIVVSGYLNLLPGVSNFSAIRVLRVLRPLRTINKLRGLRIIVKTLLQAVRALVDVFILLTFLMVCFAIIAVQVWNGVLHQRCFESHYVNDVLAGNKTIILGKAGDLCSVDPNYGYQCSPGYECVHSGDIPNPDFGYRQSDNFGAAMYMVFGAVTMADWSKTMYYYQDTWAAAVWIYFVFMILFVSFFALNLVLAVVADAFSSTSNAEGRTPSPSNVDSTHSLLSEKEMRKFKSNDDIELTEIMEKSSSQPFKQHSIDSPKNWVVSPATTVEQSSVDKSNDNGIINNNNNNNSNNNDHNNSNNNDHNNSNNNDHNSNDNNDNNNDIVSNNATATTIALATNDDDNISNNSNHNNMDSNDSTNNVFDSQTEININNFSINIDSSEVPNSPSIEIRNLDATENIKDAPNALQKIVTDHLVRVNSKRQLDIDEGNDKDKRRQSLSLVELQSTDDVEMKQAQLQLLVSKIFDGKSTNIEMPHIEFNELLEVIHPCFRKARQIHKTQEKYLSPKPTIFRKAYRVTRNKYFRSIITIAILINTIFMSIEHHGMSDNLRNVSETGNFVCTLVFIIEMIVKLAGYGFKRYWTSPWDAFDGFIVLVGLSEILFLSGSGVTVLRAFRLLRILKLLRNIRSLQTLLSTVVDSLAQVSYMTLLLALVLFMFSVLGMQLFGKESLYDNIDDPPLNQWHSIYYSFLSVFQVMTGDDWTTVMEATVHGSSSLAFLYFFLLVVVGTYLVMNLFVAILLSHFSDQNEEFTFLQSLEDEMIILLENGKKPVEVVHEMCDKLLNFRLEKYEQSLRQEEKLQESLAPKRMNGKSFGYFDSNHKLRRWCWGLVHCGPFEAFIFIAIFVNCGLLASETPNQSDEYTQLLRDFDICFAVIFVLEMLLKWVALGIYRGEGSYFKSAWNQLDAFVVLVSLVTLSFPSFAAAKSFRALRPTRVIIRSDQIKMVVTSLYRALPAITNVFLFCLMFWIIFGILGVNLFAGKFYSCNDDTIEFEENCIGTFQQINENGQTEIVNRDWSNASVHFDNVYAAIIALFQAATLSGWSGIMYQAMSATNVGESPKRNASPGAGVYFVGFIIIGGFFTLNLFIGVVIDNFNRLKQEYDGSSFLTPEQRRWVQTRKLIKTLRLDIQPLRPLHPFRAFCFDIVAAPLAIKANNHTSMHSPQANSVDFTSQTPSNDMIESSDMKSAPVRSHTDFQSFVRNRSFQRSGSFQSNTSFQRTSTFPPRNQSFDSDLQSSASFDSTTLSSRDSITPGGTWNINSEISDEDLPAHKFEIGIMAAILLNTLIMTFQHYQQNNSWNLFLEYCNIIFIVIFTLEAILKISAFTWSLYWKEAWNRFDFIIVIASLFGLVFKAGVGANVVRVFRIARIFRLIRRAQSLKRIFDTLIMSLPSLWNIACLLFVVFFIYGVLGVSFFGKVKHTEDGLTRHTNFETFGNSMITLFRLATGDNWEEVMYGAQIQPPDCSNEEGNCGSSWAPLYFISFMVLGSLVMVNLYIAVILENFAESQTKASDPKLVQAMRRWVRAWSQLDPRAKRKLPARLFMTLMERTPVPFGFGKHQSFLSITRRLRITNIPLRFDPKYRMHKSLLDYVGEPRTHSKRRKGEWVVDFYDALKVLARSVSSGKLDGLHIDHSKEVVDSWNFQWESLLPKFCRPDRRDECTLDQWYVANVLLARYRNRKLATIVVQDNRASVLELPRFTSDPIEEDSMVSPTAVKPEISITDSKLFKFEDQININALENSDDSYNQYDDNTVNDVDNNNKSDLIDNDINFNDKQQENVDISEEASNIKDKKYKETDNVTLIDMDNDSVSKEYTEMKDNTKEGDNIKEEDYNINDDNNVSDDNKNINVDNNNNKEEDDDVRDDGNVKEADNDIILNDNTNNEDDNVREDGNVNDDNKNINVNDNNKEDDDVKDDGNVKEADNNIIQNDNTNNEDDKVKRDNVKDDNVKDGNVKERNVKEDMGNKNNEDDNVHEDNVKDEDNSKEKYVHVESTDKNEDDVDQKEDTTIQVVGNKKIDIMNNNNNNNNNNNEKIETYITPEIYYQQQQSMLNVLESDSDSSIN